MQKYSTLPLKPSQEEDDGVLAAAAGAGTESNTPKVVRDRVMREYQLEGLRWMLRLHNNGVPSILGDEMGLGKTIQTLSFLAWLTVRLKIKGPHLVVCPLSVLPAWISEAEK
jgi:SWI/SNF-related matrix-associated actin-dependent regulator of chromatin subfamily A member 5